MSGKPYCEIGQKLHQHFEVGVKSNPGLLMLKKLAAGYGIGVQQLLGPEVPMISTPRNSGRLPKIRASPNRGAER